MSQRYVSIQVTEMTRARLQWLAAHSDKKLNVLTDWAMEDWLNERGVPVNARYDGDLRNLLSSSRKERVTRQAVKVSSIPKILVRKINEYARKQRTSPGAALGAAVTEYALHMRTRKLLPPGVHHYYGPSAEKGIIRGVKRPRLDQIPDNRMRPAKLVDAVRLFLHKRKMLPEI